MGPGSYLGSCDMQSQTFCLAFCAVHVLLCQAGLYDVHPINQSPAPHLHSQAGQEESRPVLSLQVSARHLVTHTGHPGLQLRSQIWSTRVLQEGIGV
jgi:hypothetical protein